MKTRAPSFERLAVAYLCGVVFVAACGSEEQAGMPLQSFDANAQVGAWVELWNTRDLGQVDELFLTDSRLTYFSSEFEGLIQGPVAVREHHAGFGFAEGGVDPDQELWVEDVQSSTYRSVAVVTAVWHFGDRMAPADSISRGPMTVVYVFDQDRYRIAHMHFANYQ